MKKRKLKRKYKLYLYFFILLIGVVLIIISFRIVQANNVDTVLEPQNIVEQSEDPIMYPSDAYTNGVLDPQKLEQENALNIGENTVLVNKKYKLDSEYEPELGEVDGFYLDKSSINDYLKMKEDALNDGVTLNIGSAYRSYNEQEAIFNSYLQKDPYDLVITYSAYPGTSEHQTGLVIDFVDGSNCDYTKCYEDTPSGKWLANNSYKYGFILRYGNEKEDITGYMYEPWHFRYVGKDVAKEIYEQNITLEEYVLEKEESNA